MIAKVVDTNVLIVANDKSEQATLDCLSQCVTALDEARQKIIVIDDAFRIFNEYKNEVSPSGQPGVGDAFSALASTKLDKSCPLRGSHAKIKQLQQL